MVAPKRYSLFSSSFAAKNDGLCDALSVCIARIYHFFVERIKRNAAIYGIFVRKPWRCIPLRGVVIAENQ